jgi:hypothetical protein
MQIIKTGRRIFITIEEENQVVVLPRVEGWLFCAREIDRFASQSAALTATC